MLSLVELYFFMFCRKLLVKPFRALCGAFCPGSFSIFLSCLAAILLLNQPAGAQNKKYTTMGYRGCGTEQGTCHQSEGQWWKGDPHFSTVNALKRKKKNARKMAQAYGLSAANYLKGNTGCAVCHGEVVSGRENKNMNTGVSCENCHGPAGPKGVGYFDVHTEGTNPQDPLATSRSGYQKALRVGLVELRNVNIRAESCVQCHQINEKKLLEAGHPTGEGFDYLKGIKNYISKHWDYQLRKIDLDEQPYMSAVQKRPIPQFSVASISTTPVRTVTTRTIIDTVLIYADADLPPWLNPKSNILIKSFDPQLSETAPIDSILLEVKKYIEYIHKTINQK